MADVKINLSRYSREDLEFIIGNMVARQGSDYQFRFAAYDLAIAKKSDEELAMFDRAEMMREAATAKRKQAEKLAEPYLRARSNLPLAAKQKYAELIKEAKEFEQQAKELEQRAKRGGL